MLQVPSTNSVLFIDAGRDIDLHSGLQDGFTFVQSIHRMGQRTSISINRLLDKSANFKYHLHDTYFILHSHAWLHLLIGLQVKVLWFSVFCADCLCGIRAWRNIIVSSVSVFVQRLYSSVDKVKSVAVLELQTNWWNNHRGRVQDCGSCKIDFRTFWSNKLLFRSDKYLIDWLYAGEYFIHIQLLYAVLYWMLFIHGSFHGRKEQLKLTETV